MSKKKPKRIRPDLYAIRIPSLTVDDSSFAFKIRKGKKLRPLTGKQERKLSKRLRRMNKEANAQDQTRP